MKKIFYFIASAIVALGAVACQNDINENIAPESEGLSFTAEVEMTRITIGEKDDKGYPVVWEEGKDELEVTYIDENEEPVTFTFTFNGEKFVCEDENANNLVGKNVSVNYYASSIYGFDSKAGKAGMCLAGEEVTFENGMTIKLSVENSFLRFSSTENVVLTVEGGDDYAFCYNDELTASTPELTGEDIWVPFYVWASTVDGTDLTLTASIDGEVVKQITRNFANGKIYNLGKIEKPEVCDFTIVGGHQGWDTANGDVMYKIAGSNTYMRSNVTLNEQGFKFYNATTEIIIEEHPAVTVGEEGDWYLKPSSNWKADNARFAIYFFGNGETWVSMKDENGDGIYVANNPTDSKNYPNMIFCRMDPSNTTNDWKNKWNQTADLTAPTDGNNLYTVKEGTWDKGGGTWSVHTPEKKDAWTEEVEKVNETWFGYNAYGGDYKIGWAQNWSNTDNKGEDIKVDDINKTYDIYFSKVEQKDYYEVFYAVLEHGSPAPELK